MTIPQHRHSRNQRRGHALEANGHDMHLVVICLTSNVGGGIHNRNDDWGIVRMQRRTARTSGMLAGAAVLSLLVLTGCGSAASESAKDYKAMSGTLPLEQAQQVVACVKDKGFTVHADTQGGVGFQGGKDVPEDQSDLALAAIEDCRNELGQGENDQVPATAEQLAKLYQLNLETKTCLEGKGFTIVEPPSEQTFVETFHNPGPDTPPWSPWGLETLKQMPPTQDATDAIRTACPDPLSRLNTL